MIYIFENKIYFYGNFDIQYKKDLLSKHLILWKAKLGNKYSQKELIDNVKTKIDLHNKELEKYN